MFIMNRNFLCLHTAMQYTNILFYYKNKGIHLKSPDIYLKNYLVY